MPFPEQFTGVTIYGLYNDQTGDALYGVAGSAAPASAIQIAGTDGTDLRVLSTTSNGFLNVNATITGGLTNNNAAPGVENLGVLPAIAATSYTTETWTNGNQVLLVTDLHGALNNDMQAVAGVQLGATAVTAFGTAPAAANVQGVNASIYSGTTQLTNTGGALNVNITGGATSVQYTDGTAESAGAFTITVAGMYNGTDVVGLRSDASNNLKVVAIGTDSDNATNSTAKIPVIPARANASAPSWTEGHEVPLSTDLSGNLRVTLVSGSSTVTGTLTNNNAAPSSNNLGVLPAVAASSPLTYTNGDQVLLTTSLGGAVRTVPVDEANASSLSYYSYDSLAAYKAIVSGSYTPLWSIQANSAAIIFLMRELQFFTSGTVCHFQLIKNGILTGASYAAGPGNMNVDTTASAVSGGTVVLSGYVGATPRNFDDLLIAIASGTPGDHFTVAAKTFSGNGSATSQVQWSEQSAAL